MGKDLDQIVNEYSSIFRQLKKRLKWHFTDERTLMMVASLYVTRNKEFRPSSFLEISDYIKNNVGMFSSLKSSQRFISAAMLDVNYDQPKEKFHEYVAVYEKLVEGGFKRGNFTFMAALCLLLGDTNETNHKWMIERAMAVYKGMKKDHFFLTGESDYPLAVLLAQVNRDIDEMMDDIDYYYKALPPHGFRKGNDLQFLSHILSLDKNVDSDILIHRISELTNMFKEAGRKIKPVFYPTIGLLSLLENGLEEVDNVMALFKRLNVEKGFRWHKDVNFIMAVTFIVKDKVEDTSLISTGIQTTIETIIQAQQAAMFAAMTGAAVAVSSSNGGSS
ncbi:DUF4003 family protein [Halalkalibacter okhensis]|uniref:DUF4003 domain-containing protein n=1 Tax=Halalkalibacter okhensis TaxID=333138 RepID=A0A0B0IIE3_9BACI|nr:DUF4003 family protein [Halalkalibacter okhensis]KHF39416.1 hypothetical protein LQ50_15255 [Halalkalibacter okhensis]